MLQWKIASRYAEALFDLAQQQGKTDMWEQELASLGTLIASTPDLYQVLTHPEIPLRQKDTLVKRAFQGKIAEEILAVLLMLIQRGREPDIDTVHTIYHQLWNKARRVIPVSVTSAAPISRTLGQCTGTNTRATHRGRHPARAEYRSRVDRRHGHHPRRSRSGCQRTYHAGRAAGSDGRHILREEF